MPFWLPNGTTLLRPDRGRGPRAAAQARLPGDRHPAGARRRALAPLRPLGQLPREHVLHGGRRAPLRAAADELPRRLPRLRLRAPLLPRAAAAAGRVRPRLPQRARGRPARPAAGPRLHPGRRPRLLHRRSRSPTRSTRICEAIDELYARFGFDDVRVELSTRPEKSIGTDEQWAKAEAALREALDAPGARVRSSTPATAPSTGRRSTSTSPTRSAAPGSAAPASSTSRCPSASTSTYTGADDAAAPAGDDPPRPARLDGALRRDPDRALRRPLPGLAGAGAGDRPAGLRPPQRVRRRGRRASCARPASGSPSTTAPSRSARRSATPSSAATPTCWSSATARRRPARSPSAPTTTASWGRWRWPISPPGSRPRAAQR